MEGRESLESLLNINGRFNIALFLLVIFAVVLNLALPNLLSNFYPCAKYVDNDPVLFTIMAFIFVGASNVVFLAFCGLEKLFGDSWGRGFRAAVIGVLLGLFAIGLLYEALGVYFPAVMIDPELMCG